MPPPDLIEGSGVAAHGPRARHGMSAEQWQAHQRLAALPVQRHEARQQKAAAEAQRALFKHRTEQSLRTKKAAGQSFRSRELFEGRGLAHWTTEKKGA